MKKAVLGKQLISLYEKGHRLRRDVVIITWALVSIACIFASDATDNARYSPVPEHPGRLSGPYSIWNCINKHCIKSLSKEKEKIAADRWRTAIDGAILAKRPIPILQEIVGQETALLIIDMQRAFLDKGAAIEVPEGRLIIDNINRLSDSVRRRGGTNIFLRYLVGHDIGLLANFERKSYLGQGRLSPLCALRRGNPQFELHQDLIVSGQDLVMDKTRYSAVLGSDIVAVLRGRGIKNVIVTGVTTDVCAGNTAEDLMQKDFNIVVAWDGTAALDRLEHELYLARIFGLYGDVMPTEEIIERLK